MGGDIFKQLIGLTCSCENDMQHKETNYTEAVKNAGAIPILIPVFTSSEKDLEQLLERIDGVILTGGQDIHPIHYGEEPKQGLGQVFPQRDEMEIALTIECTRQDTPVLGICRGMQIINVSFGGDLYQDIYRQIAGKELLLHNQNIEGEYGNHSIDIDSESFLYDIYKQKIGWVNSFHHQAIRNLSSALQPIAWSKDGIVEALIHKNYTNIFGVQWHPEKMWDKDAFSLNLFQYFVDICKKDLSMNFSF